MMHIEAKCDAKKNACAGAEIREFDKRTKAIKWARLHASETGHAVYVDIHEAFWVEVSAEGRTFITNG